MNDEKSCCCTTENCGREELQACCAQKEPWVIGEIMTPAGSVPVISTTLKTQDILGAWKVRWGIGRMNYKVTPGLYAVGAPDARSPVLVSANYKLTFDTLRRELSGLNCWLLILDTKGINVWCAAGKGTFGTDELVERISKTGLARCVEHRTLILPQLGGPGVSAHKVAQRTGFSVIYGPVRASDLKQFIQSGLKATEEMRTVKFTLWDRLVLTPLELVHAAKVSIIVFGVLLLLNLFVSRPFGLMDFLAYSGAVLMGNLLTPMLLPFIPGRAFAWKGWLMGFLWTAGFAWLNGLFAPQSLVLAIGYLLVLPSLSAFWAMNFTGSSTYTSLSGVLKEMKIAIPWITLSSAAGIVLVFISRL